MGASATANQQSSILGRLKAFLGHRPAATAPAQRRAQVRVPTDSHDLTCWAGRERVKGILKDLSSRGLRVFLSRPVRPGSVVTIRLDFWTQSDYDTVRATICWMRAAQGGYEAGIELVDRAELIERSWVMPLLERVGFAHETSAERRKSRRIPTNMRALLHSNASVSCAKATVLDLSEGGALLRTAHYLDEGVFIRIASEGVGTCPGIDVEARVVRVRPTSDGMFRVSLEFVAPSPAEEKALHQHLVRLAA